MVALAAAAAATTTADIAVIGAGAAGLVAARHLLRCGLRPTLLEASHEVGGMWTSQKEQNHASDGNRKTWTDMRTNLSRYTCCFSDFPFSQAFPEEKADHHSDALSYFFPTTFQMNEYLKSYSNHFLANNEDCTFRFGCQVTRVAPAPDNRYSVEWKSSSSQQEQEADEQQIFDGVVVATGFFSESAWPENADLSTFSGLHVHSSKYRSVEELDLEEHDPAESDSQTTPIIAVCGSSFSALEIASHIAKGQSSSSSLISSAVNDEGTTHPIPIVKHICSSIPTVMPRFLSLPNEPSQGFIPLDTALYQRPNDGLKAETILGNDAKLNTQKHDYLAGVLGRRKQEQYFRDTDIPQPYDDTTLPVYASISNNYLDLVGSGRIQIVPGRLVGSDAEGNLQVEATSKADTERSKVTSIPNVDALISCTGYRTNLGFLDNESILQTIEYDPDNKFAPLVLCDDVYHPRLKNLAFVGVYRGPYFGVAELQARMAASRLAQQVTGAEKISADLSPEEENSQDETALQDSRNVRTQKPQPQLPRSDYVGRMDSLVARVKKLPGHGLGDAPYLANKGEVVIPAMYQPDQALAESELNNLRKDLKTWCQSSGHVTPFLLQSILGKWSFERTLTQLSDYSTQSVKGTIGFSLQRDEESGEDFVLYREDGTMELAGRPIDVFREYHYTVNPTNGALEIFFVESGKRAHLFLSLLFDFNSTTGTWVATSDHLCIKDLYGGTFQVILNGLAASHLEMKYKVKGPAKDYEAVTILRPDS